MIGRAWGGARSAAPEVWLCLLLMLGAAAGCGPAGSPAPPGRRVQPVVDGVPTVGTEDHGVVWLIIPGNDSISYACTGTLIHPRVVLTAAHCFDFGFALGGERVFFGAAPDRALDGIDVVHVLRNPGFSSQGVGGYLSNDLALEVLARDAPSPARPWPILPSSLAGQLPGRAGRVVGYGLTAASGGVSGVKHRGSVTIAAVADTTVDIDPNPGHPCFGDSGGPLFSTVDGSEYLVGVLSTGDQACAGVKGSLTRADAFYQGFIEPFLNRIATGSQTLGERCYFEGNCGEGTCTSSEARENVKYCSRSCTSDSDCAGGMLCRGATGQRMCHYPRVHPEVLSGIICAGDSFCETNRCSRLVAGGVKICTIACTPSEQNACPSGHRCVPDLTNGGSACLKVSSPPPGSGGGCTAGGPAGGAGLALLAGLLGLLPLACRRRPG